MTRLFRWFRNLFRREPLVSMPISFTREEVEFLHWWSEETKQDLEAGLHDLVMRSFPSTALEAYERHKRYVAMLPEMKAREEREDSDIGGVFPFPPEPAPKEDSFQFMPSLPSEVLKRRLKILHPCLHLDEGDPTPFHLQRSEVEGICYAPARLGGPCHWPVSSAKGCPYFTSKRARHVS